LLALIFLLKLQVYTEQINHSISDFDHSAIDIDIASLSIFLNALISLKWIFFTNLLIEITFFQKF